jgi:hypothetical protein
VPDPKETTWLRPEFEGRDHELLSFSEFVALAGKERNTVRQWMLTYDHFPKPVKEVPFGNGPARYYVPGEVVDWLLRHRPRLDDPARERARLRIAMAQLDDEIKALTTELRHKRSLYEQINPLLEDQ